MSPTYRHPRPAVTVDVTVVGRESDGAPSVLLVRRGREPFAGMWALPGGFVDEDEDLPDAARRELREETGLEIEEIEQLGAWGTPGRDPRGHTVSVVYVAEADRGTPAPRAGDDAAAVAWHRLDALPPLAFDHVDILAALRRRLAST